MTLFGSANIRGIEDVMFVKALLIHKGTENLYDNYIGLWSDPDIGNAYDDLVACDTDCQIGYCYNGEEIDEGYFESKPPAVGYQILQGPIIPSSGNTARFLGQDKPDYENLDISAFNKFANTYDDFVDPENDEEVYNVLQGKRNNGSSFTNPITNQADPILFTGDPVTGSGWLESEDPEDRRMLISMGPFDFAVGDTQEVIFAMVVGEGSDNLSGINTMRQIAAYTQEVYDNNFTNFNIPVNMTHTVSDTLQGETTNTVTLTVEPRDDINIQEDNISLVVLNPENHAQSYSVTMQSIGNNQYTGEIANDGALNDFEYYFTVLDADYYTYYTYPLAAPEVYFKQSMGPDNTAPEISYEPDTTQTIYFNGNVKVTGTVNYEDRFPFNSLVVQSRLNEGEWIDCPTIISNIQSSNTFDIEDDIQAIEWQSDIQYADANYNDVCEYRVVVTDASSNQNQSISKAGQIHIKKTDAIGNFSKTTFDKYSKIYDSWEFDGWNLMSNIISPYTGYSVLPDSVYNYRDNLNNTLTYYHVIPMCDYDSVYLMINQIQWINAGDTGFTEISPDMENWQPVHAHSNDASISATSPEWFVMSLKKATDMDSLYFRLRFQTDENEESNSFGWYIANIQLAVDTTMVTNSLDDIPTANTFKLNSNYPNPFNPSTTISFELPKSLKTEINIYNLRGQLVETLVNKDFSAGRHQVNWNAGNLPSGVYLYQIQAGEFHKTMKCILLK